MIDFDGGWVDLVDGSVYGRGGHPNRHRRGLTTLPFPQKPSPQHTQVNKSGHLLDLRFHRYHETNQEKAKRKAQQARRKARMLRLSLRKGQKL